MNTSTSGPETFNQELQKWNKQQNAALEFINAAGKLILNHSVELVMFRNSLIDLSVPEILNLHLYSADMVKRPVDIFTTTELAKEMLSLNLAPTKLDIGKLAFEWSQEKGNFADQNQFLNHKLGEFIGTDDHSEPQDVVLYGFGRIGRLVARELVKQAGKGQQLRLKAIVTRNNSGPSFSKRADLFRMDSVHGPFPGTVIKDEENQALIINGQFVKLIEAKQPDEVDYEQYGIKDALVIDNTGAFRDRTSLSRHLKSKGVSKVLLTAPGKEIPNIVFGVNHQDLNLESETIFSAASCTTNAIVPVLKVVNDTLGIEKGHIESIHAYTNDQNLLDNMHKKHRRGRSAAINMVITETGAAKAVVKVIPALNKKLTANAVRVPTPNGSLAIMNLNVQQETTVEKVNQTLKDAAYQGGLVNQILYSAEDELVSSDIIGSPCPAVFDSNATLVSEDGKSIVLYTWYDNEYGYVLQVIGLAKHVMKVNRGRYY